MRKIFHPPRSGRWRMSFDATLVACLLLIAFGAATLLLTRLSPDTAIVNRSMATYGLWSAGFGALGLVALLLRRKFRKCQER